MQLVVGSGDLGVGLTDGCMLLSAYIGSDFGLVWPVAYRAPQLDHPFGYGLTWPKVGSQRFPDTSRLHQVLIPIWLILVPVVIAAIYLWRSDRRTAPGHCPHCNYNLTGNTTGTCPECGHALADTAQ